MKRLSNIEYGLMTLSEYLEHRNPESKTHEEGSYTFSVESMNEDHSIIPYQIVANEKSEYSAFGKADQTCFYFCRAGKVRAVIAKGMIFYSYTREKDFFSSCTLSSGWAREYVFLGSMKLKGKKVKYPSDYLGLVSDKVARNTKRYPHFLERFENKGEVFTVRSETPLKWGKNEGVTIGIFNAEGFKVATAQDEWGATLIGVAVEYRSRGLSKIISKYWYRANPDKLSGGFTSSGQKMAISYWADRVREMHLEGVYQKMILEGKITSERVEEIMADLPPKVQRSTQVQSVKPTNTLALYVDNQSVFVLYDPAYLIEQDEKFILGYGLLRSDSIYGMFYYQMDYERKYTELVTKIGLQYARELGDSKLYDGEGDHYSDILEIEGISDVSKRDSYIYVERDLIDLREMKMFDQVARSRLDKYDELLLSLLEDAYAKWS